MSLLIIHTIIIYLSLHPEINHNVNFSLSRIRNYNVFISQNRGFNRNVNYLIIHSIIIYLSLYIVDLIIM